MGLLEPILEATVGRRRGIPWTDYQSQTLNILSVLSSKHGIDNKKNQMCDVCEFD